MVCSEMFENVAFSKSLIMCAGTLKIPAISERLSFIIDNSSVSTGDTVSALYSSSPGKSTVLFSLLFSSALALSQNFLKLSHAFSLSGVFTLTIPAGRAFPRKKLPAKSFAFSPSPIVSACCWITDFPIFREVPRAFTWIMSSGVIDNVSSSP